MKEQLKCLTDSTSIMALINDLDDYVQLIIYKEVADYEYFRRNSNAMHLKTTNLINELLSKIRYKAKIIEL